jgi:hypothetical protein
MAAIYGDQHRPLKELLAMAGKNENATLLIPDLQRPYIWDLTQVVILVDSLIRGWPFGTLLTWKVKPDDPARALARSFWRVVDRTGSDGQPICMRHPPAMFYMVLDGQQRVQSLLLAFGGDGWGFKLLDRKWHEHLEGKKTSGPRGQLHWSLGCLCINVSALGEAYVKAKRATAIDYTKVLHWVVTDDANGQSGLKKPPNYKPPLPKASEGIGRFVRLSRLWEVAPEQAGIDSYEAEGLANSILEEHGASEDMRNNYKRALGALLMTLKDVKQTRVTYLELAEHEEALGPRESYNDAIVNIFTRLNTAGRTLTREDITFAWLKVGWNTAFTANQSAKVCIEELARDLEALSVPIPVEDVISAISFVWSVSFNSGRLLNNDDLMKGEAIRPMAAHVSENWSLVKDAVTRVCEHARDRGLRFREHYQSVNALAYLWALYFVALIWGQGRELKELEKDSMDKTLAATLDLLMDRWLICSQWAGVWASAQRLGDYALQLAMSAKILATKPDVASAIAELKQCLELEIKNIESAAVEGLRGINAEDRQDVRTYYTALWIWNRMERERWEMAKVALRQESRSKNRCEVDHIVAYHLWQSKLKAIGEKSATSTAITDSTLADANNQELTNAVNELGNCMLLEKNFNISKSNKPLKQFLEGVHEFKTGELTIQEWAKALHLEISQVDSSKTTVEAFATLLQTVLKKSTLTWSSLFVARKTELTSINYEFSIPVSCAAIYRLAQPTTRTAGPFEDQ